MHAIRNHDRCVRQVTTTPPAPAGFSPTVRFLVTMAVLLPCGHAFATEIALQLGPGGAASLINSSLDTPVVLVSYSVTRDVGGVEFLPDEWDSLQQQGLGFLETSATRDLLSEKAVADGLLFEPGQSRSIGVPFLLRSDADASGRIDLTDFGIWKSHQGQALTGPAFGDFNYSGVVDLDDFQFLLMEMGNAAVYSFDATVAVPEPTWPLLIAPGLAALLAMRRRPRRAPHFAASGALREPRIYRRGEMSSTRELPSFPEPGKISRRDVETPRNWRLMSFSALSAPLRDPVFNGAEANRREFSHYPVEALLEPIQGTSRFPSICGAGPLLVQYASCRTSEEPDVKKVSGTFFRSGPTSPKRFLTPFFGD